VPRRAETMLVLGNVSGTWAEDNGHTLGSSKQIAVVALYPTMALTGLCGEHSAGGKGFSQASTAMVAAKGPTELLFS